MGKQRRKQQILCLWGPSRASEELSHERASHRHKVRARKEMHTKGRAPAKAGGMRRRHVWYRLWDWVGNVKPRSGQGRDLKATEFLAGNGEPWFSIWYDSSVTRNCVRKKRLTPAPKARTTYHSDTALHWFTLLSLLRAAHPVLQPQCPSWKV